MGTSPNKRVGGRDQPQYDEQAIADRHHLGVGFGGGQALIGKQAPDAEQQVHDVVQDVDRKQAQRVTVE
jgi:hypothetical protein